METKIITIKIDTKSFDIILPAEAVKRIKELEEPGDTLELILRPKEKKQDAS